MRACIKCGNKKSESEFYIKDLKTKRLHAQCKECYAIQRKKTYAKHYEKYRDQYRLRARLRRASLRTIFHDNMLAFLDDKSCVICNEQDVRVLEFDHIDPQQKSYSVSQAVRLGKTWDEVKQEIDKCRILCSNCHKKHTAAQARWYKNI